MTEPKTIVKLRTIFLERLQLLWSSTLNPMKKNIKAQMKTDTHWDTDEKDTHKVDKENEYIPQKWSTKFKTPEEVLQQYKHFITAESASATISVPNELDVTYESISGQKLDIFGTDLPADSPILLYVHGGYWKQISKDISRFPAASFHKSGVKTFVVGYDHRRSVTLWDIVNQVKDAVVFAFNYAKENGSRGVYLAGHCSGAHIIAKVLENSELFHRHSMKLLSGVFLISGLYDLQDFCLTAADDSVALAKMDAINLSPLFNSYTHLEHSNIRFYILAAQEDSPTFKKQSRDFYDLLFNICPMKNMFLQIIDDMDHFEMVKCLTYEDNYLKNLILHDLRKNCL